MIMRLSQSVCGLLSVGWGCEKKKKKKGKEVSMF